MKRRNFIRQSIGFSAASCIPWIVPGSVFGSADSVLPGDKINLAFIGLGRKAFTGVLGSLLQSFIAEPACRVVALCDVYQPHLDRALNYVNEYYGNKDCAAYHDFREVLLRSDIDAVVIAVPDHWHAIMTAMACESGKDVYCEKSVVDTVDEARRVTETARRYSRVVQCGSQSRSNPKFEYACDLIKGGKIGQINKVEVNCYMNPPKEAALPVQDVSAGLDWDMWLGPAPYRPYNEYVFDKWREFPDFGGGGIADRGSHQFDIVQWGLGMDFSGPAKIIPPGDGGKEWCTFEYPDGTEVTIYDLNSYKKIRQGVHFHGSDGMIFMNPISADTEFIPSILDRQFITDKTKNLNWRKNIHGTNHYTNFLDCIRSRKMPNAQIEIGARSSSLCVVTNLAYKLGRALEWDGERMEIRNSDETLIRLASRSMREPWHI